MEEAAATVEFVRWGASHWAALAAWAMAGSAVLYAGCRAAERGKQALCRAYALFLVLQPAAEFLYRAYLAPSAPDGECLPLHYCSVMMFVSAYALWSRARWASAMVYFSVLTASVQALITPALSFEAPHPRYFFFFLSHGALFVAALMLPLVQGWRARKWDMLLTLGLMDVYMLLVIPVNLLLGANYGFTQQAPPGSILSYLGPAPWYFLVLHLPGLLVFYLLYLPVAGKRSAA